MSDRTIVVPKSFVVHYFAWPLVHIRSATGARFRGAGIFSYWWVVYALWILMHAVRYALLAEIFWALGCIAIVFAIIYAFRVVISRSYVRWQKELQEI